MYFETDAPKASLRENSHDKFIHILLCLLNHARFIPDGIELTVPMVLSK